MEKYVQVKSQGKIGELLQGNPRREKICVERGAPATSQAYRQENITPNSRSNERSSEL